MNIKILTATAGLGLLLSGCATSTLNLNYDKNSKITTIDMGKDRKYEIKNSKMLSDRTKSATLNSGSSNRLSFVSKGICSQFTYVHLPPLEKNQYYTTFSKADVHRMYSGYDCKTKSYDPIEFHECGDNYIITFDEVSPEQGFLYEKKYLTIRDKECYEEIKKVMK